MAESNSLEAALESLFDESSPAETPAAMPESGIGAWVEEFLTLDRRRIHGDPDLDPAEAKRLGEVRERLEYEFGSGSPPVLRSRRASLRVPTRIKVQTGAGGGLVANLCSLSRGGAFIELADPPERGSRMELALEPGDGAAPLQLAAVVRWVREIANMDGPAGVGVEFAGVEDDDFIALEKLFARALHALARNGA